MKPADKFYAERGREHDPDPAEEVFESFKALIAVIAVVGAIGMIFAAWWHK